MGQSAKQFLSGLRKRFAAEAAPENAKAMKAYLRNQFEFFGLKAPAIRTIVSQHLTANGLPEIDTLKKVVALLWREPERELQHAALELLYRRRKELTLADLPLLEELVTTRSWWDTVDFISYKLIGQLLARHPNRQTAIARRLSSSGHLWLIRVSLIFQLLRKEQTDAKLLAELIEKHANHPDFFIRKAIGWALRDYAKTNPIWVHNFVGHTNLSPLSVREALKNL
jgi:3-methyladenine DNA glycosylase AlkD